MKIWGDFEGVKRYDTLKVFQVKLGSLVWASIKVAGSQADATDMLVSLFVIISRRKAGKKPYCIDEIINDINVYMKDFQIWIYFNRLGPGQLFPFWKWMWMRMTREI